MTSALPRDIMSKLERRWTSRVIKAESFHDKADLSRPGTGLFAEDAQPPTDRPAAPKWEEPPARN